MLFASESELGDAATIAGWFHTTLRERSLLNLAERLEIIGNTEVVDAFLKSCTTKEVGSQRRLISLGGQISASKYHKEVSNSQRVFYISLRHLSTDKRARSADPYAALLTPGALRLAKVDELPLLKKIYHAQAAAGEDSDSDSEEGTRKMLLKIGKFYLFGVYFE